MKIAEDRTIQIDLSHQEIMDWARSKAIPEMQRILGLTRGATVTAESVDVALCAEAVASADPEKKPTLLYTIRVTYREGHGEVQKTAVAA